MVVEVFNPYDLSEEMINGRVTRVKALITNSNKEVLFCKINSVYSLIGGHVEQDETLLSGLKRRVQEETGIILEGEGSYQPIMKLESWNKNHFNSGQKCLSIMYYFLIGTNQRINYSNMNLYSNERNKDFKLEYVSINKIPKLLRSDEIYQAHKTSYEEIIRITDYCFKIPHPLKKVKAK